MTEYSYTPVKGKAAFEKDWPNKHYSLEEARQVPGATGVAINHNLSHTCAIDIDDLEQCIELFKEKNIDILKECASAYEVVSPKKNRKKFIFEIPQDTKLEYYRAMKVLELRCGKHYDVMPDSKYPDGSMYTHAGSKTITPLPQVIVDFWLEQMACNPKEIKAPCSLRYYQAKKNSRHIHKGKPLHDKETIQRVPKEYNAALQIPPEIMIVDIDLKNGADPEIFNKDVSTHSGFRSLYKHLEPNSNHHKEIAQYKGIEFFSSTVGKHIIMPPSVVEGIEYAYINGNATHQLITEIHVDKLPEFPADIWAEIKKEPAEKGEVEYLPIHQLQGILEVLHPNYFSEYDEWFRIMAFFHQQTDGSDTGLEFFIRWSAQDPDNFDHETEKKIRSSWQSCDPSKAPTVQSALKWLNVLGNNAGQHLADYIRVQNSITFGKIPTAEAKLPLVDFERIEFPLDCLPKNVRDLSLEISKKYKVDVTLPALCYLQFAVACFRKGFIIEEKSGLTHTMTPSTIVVSHTGGRKTAVYKIFEKPLIRLENQSKKEWKEQKVKDESFNTVIEIKIAKIEKGLKSVSSEITEKEVEEHTVSLNEAKQQLREISKMPELYISDATESEIIRSLEEQKGRISLMSSESRDILQVLMGRYDSVNVDSTTTILKMITGDRIKFKRKNEAAVIDDPSGSVFFLVQGDRAMSMYSNEGNIDSGFVARMLPVYIDTNQGKQQEEYEEEPLSQFTEHNLGCVYGEILNMGKTNCKLSPEAKRARVDFNNKMQERFKTDLKNHFDEFNKMVSFSVQIACLFAVLDNNGKKSDDVSLEQYERAVIYTEYRIANAILFINSYGTKRLYEGVNELINWLNKAKREQPTRRRYFVQPFRWADLKNNVSNKGQKNNMNIYRSLLIQHGLVAEVGNGLSEFLWHYE